MTWLYRGEPFTHEMVGDYYGFVYCITNTVTGQKYIGKKFFYSKRTLPPLKGKTRKRHATKDSGWQDYWSSSDIVKSQVQEFGEENFTREILSLHHNKAETNYGELSVQIVLNVLEARDEAGERMYLNENIAMKFYPSKKFGELRCKQHDERLGLVD